jgi:hypothetical protein
MDEINEINDAIQQYNDEDSDNDHNVQLLLSILDAHPEENTGGAAESTGGVTVAGAAETTYIESNNDKRVLFAMCVGIVNQTGDALVNLELPPWSTIKKRRKVVPNQKTLYMEMKRCLGDCNEGPRAANWPMAKITDWLMKNPITLDVDQQFLRQEINKFRTVIAAAEQSTSEKNWRGAVPYLRIIMLLTEDDIKEEFIKHGMNKTRLELDARNSEIREKTVFELIAERWNDENYNPVVPSFLVHEDFRRPTDCSYEKVKDLLPATGEKVRNTISHMRASLNRIIANWEQSGQGDAGNLPENAATNNQHGNLLHRSAAALDSRASFLGDGYPSYLLVLWEIADSHQILKHTLQRLSVSVGTDALTPPSVIRRPTSPPTMDQSIGSILNETMDLFAERMANAQRENAETMASAHCENQIFQEKNRRETELFQEKERRETQFFQEKVRINSRISSLTDMIRSTKKEKFRSTNEEEKQFLLEEIDSMEKEIDSLKESLREFGRN